MFCKLATPSFPFFIPTLQPNTMPLYLAQCTYLYNLGLGMALRLKIESFRNSKIF